MAAARESDRQEGGGGITRLHTVFAHGIVSHIEHRIEHHIPEPPYAPNSRKNANSRNNRNPIPR